MLLLFVPYLFLRDFSPQNELRYLCIADEALRDGHLFGFMHHGSPYADKPPLYLWIVMGLKSLTGSHSLGLISLFSLLPAFAIIFILSYWIKDLLGKEGIIATLLLLMTTTLFVGPALFVRMDMLMCLFMVLALYSFYKIYAGTGGPYQPWLLVLWLFMAVFTKGPLGLILPLVSMLTFLVVKKQLRTWKRYLGWQQWIALLALFVLWFGIVWLEKGTGYLYDLTFNQTVNRAVDAFHHKEPVYFYFKALLYAVAPWTLLVFSAIWTGIRRRLFTGDRLQFFCIICLTQFAVLSLISSKLAIYLLPVIPFLLLLTVWVMKSAGYTGWMAAGLYLPALIILAVLPVYLWLATLPGYEWLQPVKPFIIAGWCAGIICNLYAVYQLIHSRRLLRPAIWIASGILLFTGIAGWSVPQINNRIGFREVATVAMELSPEENIRYYTCGIRRPKNMEVFLKVPVEEVTPGEVVAGKCSGAVLLIAGNCLQDREELQSFLQGKQSREVGGVLVICP